MEPTRQALGTLLAKLGEQPKAHDTRLEAARTALALCFRRGDPHFADVAEALVADAPRFFPKAKRIELDKLAAQATATRRALAMAHRQAHKDPSSLSEALIRDPEQLAIEIEQRLDEGQIGLAKAVLEVGLTRHRDDARLQDLRLRLQGSWAFEPSGGER